jgi:hypothetical protein
MIIGITGYARTGKDTLANGLKMILKNENIGCKKLSFAWALKKDLDYFLVSKTGISAFTEDKNQKELIRPLMVTYGSDIMRKIDPDYWIKCVRREIDEKHRNKIIIIPDVRFENESKWIKSEGGKIILLRREINGILIPPANDYEKENSGKAEQYADSDYTWNSEDLKNLNGISENLLTELFGDFKVELNKYKIEDTGL